MQLRPITLIQASLASLTVVASGGSSLAFTAAPANSNSQPQSFSGLVAVAEQSGNACDLDTRLAAKVMRNSLLDRTYSTRSILNINATGPGLDYSVAAQIATLTQAPGQFRSEITFGTPIDRQPSEYLITSNGEQVWIYDKMSDRYSTMTTQAFQESNDDFVIGMMASLGRLIQADFNKMAAMNQLSEAELAMLLSQLLSPCQESKLSVDMRSVNGKSYQTFSYADNAEDFIMEGFMNRQTGELDYFKIKGDDNGLEIEMHEEIVSRTAMEEVASTTFEFIPPATAQEADQPIRIRPF